jgi:hypothetical protein
MMQNRVSKLIIAVIAGILSAITSVYAVSVQPSVLKLQLAPGETKNGTFDIYNRADKELFIKVHVKDWIINPRTGEREFSDPGTNPKSIADWLIIEPEGFLIGPDRHQTVRYTIKIPKNVKGGYWGLICFTSKPLERRGGVVAAGEVVSFVGVEVRNTIKRRIKILDVKGYNDNKGMRLKVEVKNIGNAPIFNPAPIGKYIIKDKNKKTIAKGKLKGQMILPGEVIEYETIEPVKLDKGEYTGIVFFDYGMKKLKGKKVKFSTASKYDWKILKEIKKKKKKAKATPKKVAAKK